MSNNRDYKNFVAGEFYHIYNRGNNKKDIFFDDEDYLFFLKRLRQNLFPGQYVEPYKKGKYVAKELAKDAFSLVGYSLMPNHFHLIIKQKTPISITKLMSKLCTSYSKSINLKYMRVGSLFQDQFKAVHIKSQAQLLWLSAYVHCNPLRAGLVDSIEDYPYSSYHEYMKEAGDGLCDKEAIMAPFQNDPSLYEKYVLGEMGTISTADKAKREKRCRLGVASF